MHLHTLPTRSGQLFHSRPRRAGPDLPKEGNRMGGVGAAPNLMRKEMNRTEHATLTLQVLQAAQANALTPLCLLRNPPTGDGAYQEASAGV